MANIILTLLLISLILNAATSQTFQYSRGWTNGKRDGTAGLYNPYSADGCDGMNTFIMVAVDGKWQRTEISCEEMLKAINLSLSKKRRSVPTEFPFHRRPVATSDDNNNNNY